MDQYQQQHIMGLIAGVWIFALLLILVFVIFFIFLYWRIFTKAGLAGPLALLLLIPGIGRLIVLCILAFGRWNVVPAPPLYGALPPNYPPPYPPPPPGYPPAPPPTL
ncbi:MAG TPA: hypothetical protein VHY48_03730 [Acidobacteriaceae bacterium]|jgi:hypothetical protein|nr:hypothetical protein [Acidobacteriaceae bacterium]